MSIDVFSDKMNGNLCFHVLGNGPVRVSGTNRFLTLTTTDVACFHNLFTDQEFHIYDVREPLTNLAKKGRIADLDARSKYF